MKCVFNRMKKIIPQLFECKLYDRYPTKELERIILLNRDLHSTIITLHSILYLLTDGEREKLLILLSDVSREAEFKLYNV